jgi:SNF family Na+-dependent transporter
VAGLFIQIFFFRFFVIAAVTFHVRILRRPTALSASHEIPWRSNLGILYLSSGTILVRSIFRIVEYLMGASGFLLQHEYMLYIFDALLMLSVVSIFIWRHPAKTLSESTTQRSDRASDSEATYELYGGLKGKVGNGNAQHV